MTRAFRTRFLPGLVALAFSPAARADPATAPVPPQMAPMPRYETVLTVATPLHGSGLPRDEVPANVQTVTAAQIAAQHSLDLSAYLGDAVGGVNVNSVQGNPLQPDLQYRGFLASPLLGAPQGLSMYLDGVRLNEPFGDTINWDLIPTNAIRSVNVIPGSNPIFGLEHAGRRDLARDQERLHRHRRRREPALWLVRTKARARQRRRPRRDIRPVRRGAGLRRERLARTLPHALRASVRVGVVSRPRGVRRSRRCSAPNTSMTGNGASPEQLLATDRRAVFTYPDRTENQMFMALLRGEAPAGAVTRASRASRTCAPTAPGRSNGDQRDWSECTAMAGVLCSTDDGGAETPVLDGDGEPGRRSPSAVQRRPQSHRHPAEQRRCCRRSSRSTLRWPRARIICSSGSAPTRAASDFAHNRRSAPSPTIAARPISASSTPRRRWRSTAWSTTSGSTPATPGGPASGSVPDLSGRLNLSSLSLDDQLGDDLTGDHSFHRFNPAAGLSYQPRPWLGVYVSYGESSRAPTAIELTCASPTDPCRLPNAFVADPPLPQVVARTFEAGVRGTLRRGAGA